jgi:hypothetical protein
MAEAKAVANDPCLASSSRRLEPMPQNPSVDDKYELAQARPSLERRDQPVGFERVTVGQQQAEAAGLEDAMPGAVDDEALNVLGNVVPKPGLQLVVAAFLRGEREVLGKAQRLQRHPHRPDLLRNGVEVSEVVPFSNAVIIGPDSRDAEFAWGVHASAAWTARAVRTLVR